METAKNTDLPDLLEHLGYQVRQVGRFHTTKEMDSIRIKDRRSWKRYSNGTGGDAITFLQEFCGKDFKEAATTCWSSTASTPETLLFLAPGQPGRRKNHPLSCPSPTRISGGCSPIFKKEASRPR